MGHAGKNGVQFFLLMQGWKVMVIMQQQQLQTIRSLEGALKEKMRLPHSISNDTIDKVRHVGLPVCGMYTWEHSCFSPLLTGQSNIDI